MIGPKIALTALIVFCAVLVVYCCSKEDAKPMVNRVLSPFFAASIPGFFIGLGLWVWGV